MAFDELLNWSTQDGRPLWQRDALRRIAFSGELTDDDLADLKRLVEKHAGLIEDDMPLPEPLEAAHLSDDSTETPRTILGSIGPVRNVDRLANDQPPLRFATNGVTLIYGANASGKSGYCRIAKELCAAHSKQSLRGNAYDENEGTPPEIDLSFGLSGDTPETRNLTWQQGSPPPSELARISVFDTACARVYVDSERRINFLPYELDLLNKLGICCKAFDRTYQQREEQINADIRAQLPAGFQDATAVSQALVKLVPQSPLAELPTAENLRALGIWTDEKQQELEGLEAEIATEPAVQLRVRQNASTNLESFAGEIEELVGSLGDEAITSFLQQRQAMVDKASAAETAAQSLAEDLPIPDIGGDAWRLMLVYAREFAVEIFADRDEPRLATGETCVLCQQALDDAAEKRMRAFDAFVGERAATESARATSDFNAKCEAIRSLRVRPRTEVESLLDGFAGLSEGRRALTSLVTNFYAQLSARHEALKALINEERYEAFEGFDPLPESPEEVIRTEIEILGVEIEALEEQGQDEGRLQRLNAARAELLDQKRLSEVLDTVLQRRDRLEERLRILDCRSQCRSDPVTRQITARRRVIMTQSLKSALDDELKALKLKHLPLDMSDRGQAGESIVEVSLAAQRQIRKNSEILSEGEQRALALSCFLAELNEVGSEHGIIVDDPVSSLDHTRMEAVAKRLAEEAAGGRQVIIFTHNILFHSMMQSEARKAGVSCHYEWMTSLGGEMFGVIDEAHKPWQMKKPPQRVQEVREEFAALKRDGYDPGNVDHRPKVVLLYGAMRETWEKTVEDIIFNGVVQRFKPEIQTLRLEQVAFDPNADYPTIFEGMKRCSHYSGHDRAEDLPAELPDEAQIEADIDALNDFVQAARERQRALANAPRYEHGPEPEFLV
ncbi:AAA family ATPase [Thalassospira alkalitolerans]|uniref:AAA family ATPase n=1 Tax=Thalassospira alkalitolerans TaxID=1293890 RepID=UPI003AA9AE15